MKANKDFLQLMKQGFAKQIPTICMEALYLVKYGFV